MIDTRSVTVHDNDDGVVDNELLRSRVVVVTRFSSWLFLRSVPVIPTTSFGTETRADRKTSTSQSRVTTWRLQSYRCQLTVLRADVLAGSRWIRIALYIAESRRFTCAPISRPAGSWGPVPSSTTMACAGSPEAPADGPVAGIADGLEQLSVARAQINSLRCVLLGCWLSSLFLFFIKTIFLQVACK